MNNTKEIKKKRIYLANSYGFSEQQKELLEPIIKILESMGLEVWEPFSHSGIIKNAGIMKAYTIAHDNLKEIKKSDAIFAIINGCPVDEGVAFELGYATALQKKCFLFRDDCRTCSDNEDYPVNLMLCSSIPHNWYNSYYKSLDEINSKDKELYKWINGE